MMIKNCSPHQYRCRSRYSFLLEYCNRMRAKLLVDRWMDGGLYHISFGDIFLKFVRCLGEDYDTGISDGWIWLRQINNK